MTPRPDRHPVAAVAAAAVTAGVLVGGCAASGPAAAPVARAYLADWSHARYRAAAALTDQPAAAATQLRVFAGNVGLTALGVKVVGVQERGGSATATFDARAQVGGLGVWSYRGRLRLVRSGTRWLVGWTVADLYPGLDAEHHLLLVRSLPPRGALLDDTGAPLFTEQPVVTVGLERARVRDAAAVLATLAQVLGIDAPAAATLLARATPHEFVPLIVLRRGDYEAAKPRIYALPGVVFATGTEPLAPSRDFARALLGRVGTATADVLRAAGPGYAPGDLLGLWGLQAAYQRRLAGTASGSLLLVDRTGATTRTLATFASRAAQPVRTTLDRHVQQAAEAALAGIGKPAALVAVRVSTGAVLADADLPADSAFDRALVGRYPPGSTFKVVTTYALLRGGLSPDTPVSCPPQVSVTGKVFRNFEGEAPGTVAFRRDFAVSCNTAFVGLSRRLTAGSLAAAASAFGLGGDWSLPVPVFTGSVPPPATPLDLAAAAIGQGRDLVSPLAMALAAAAVASGTWRPPVLVTDPAGRTPGARPLDAAALARLRALMRLVVTSGTGTAADLPGTPVFGKTGTAEYGSGSPPPTHAWFVGWRGDVAFAVLVEGGGVGGQVAAPAAARFLRALG